MGGEQRWEIIEKDKEKNQQMKVLESYGFRLQNKLLSNFHWFILTSQPRKSMVSPGGGIKVYKQNMPTVTWHIKTL